MLIESLYPTNEIIIYHSLIIFVTVSLFTRFFFSKNIFLIFLISALKTSVFYIYFIYFMPDLNSRVDDLYYYEKIKLYLDNFNISKLGWASLYNSFESYHVLYPLLGSFVVYLLGGYYTSLIVFNVIITVVCAFLAGSILKEQGYYWHKYFVILFLLFPDLLAYSSATSGKDSFVILAHILFIKSYSGFLLGNNKNYFWSFVLATLISLFTRFYLVILFYILFFIFTSIFKKNFWKISLTFFFLAVVFDVFYALLSLSSTGLDAIVQFADGSLLGALITAPYGFIHFLLTPLPYNITIEHNYLLIPSILNLTALPFIALGIIKIILNKRSAIALNKLKFERFILFYYLLFVVFYSFIDFLNGPRHRVQLVFAIVFFIILGLRTLNFKKEIVNENKN